ncbi:MAG: TRAP transporter large permease subunit [Gammaproteobacteria bacterium]|nr:TRAP transporter large permease subunit [Gammaproteobacteria bacterium]
MLFGLSGVEIALLIVLFCLFAGILTGYPVAFALCGAAVVSFTIIALLSDAGLLYTIELHDGVTEKIPVLEGGWQKAMLSTLSTWAQGVFARAFGGNVETLLAVPLFVMMGIALERAGIAEDLLTTMAKIFRGLPGGLAISVVLVGTLLAASTGIVGATVVTMGLIALPTMLRHGYSPELSTGVIATAGTLGQIIPPSIVIVLLGSIVGDMYSIGQEARADELGMTVLEMLGEPAVLSTGTLFKAAFIPGLFLALLYAAYAFGYALLNPSKAPPIKSHETDEYDLAAHYDNKTGLMVAAVVGPMVALITLWVALAAFGIVGSQQVVENHANAPVSHGIMAAVVILGILMCLAQSIRPHHSPRPIVIGLLGLLVLFIIDAWLIDPEDTGGIRFIFFLLPALAVIHGLKAAIPRLMEVDALRVVSPPIILIIAVLGSILGGITNPTPAAALGAAGAVMLAASYKLKNDARGQRIIVWSSLGVLVMLLLRANFDLRMTLDEINFESLIAIVVALIAFHVAIFGLAFACWVLIRQGIMKQVVRETTKVTSMVFAILIGSLFLSLTIRSFGGEEYIQEILKSFDDPRVLLLVVMGVLFFLGFVLDFIEIIFIVIPIVGPVIYSADPALMPPEWITILIAVNLQTSFISPPFGFALFYLRGVAPPSITTGHLYRGIMPFVIIQVIGLIILWNFPALTTFFPELVPAQ